MSINTDTFDYQESRWQDLFIHLQNEGFEVYSPDMKVGECLKPYIVIKNDGSTRIAGISTDQDLYSVMCYVPGKQYSKLEPMVQKVKKAMVKIQPLFMPYGQQQPSFYDDAFKAHMVSIEYKNYKFIPRITDNI